MLMSRVAVEEGRAQYRLSDMILREGAMRCEALARREGGCRWGGVVPVECLAESGIHSACRPHALDLYAS